jgi:hypothetical protein
MHEAIDQIVSREIGDRYGCPLAGNKRIPLCGTWFATLVGDRRAEGRRPCQGAGVSEAAQAVRPSGPSSEKCIELLSRRGCAASREVHGEYLAAEQQRNFVARERLLTFRLRVKPEVRPGRQQDK